jgi:ubiquinone/menaquinone biosynthesis C-methylase UbiE
MNKKSLKEIKKDQYINKKIVSSYDNERFSGRSGIFVNKIELGTLSNYFDKDCNLILDLACGTGRFTHHLIKNGKKVISLDSSPTMIEEAKKKVKGIFILGDMFNLPFEDDYFDGIVIGRVFQHFKNLSPILKEMKRVVKPNGIIAFDTWLWSPRCIHKLYNKSHPKVVYGHSIKEIKRTLKRNNLKMIKHKSFFLLPPGIYSRIPFGIVKVLNFIEKIVPNSLKVKTFWKVTKL